VPGALLFDLDDTLIAEESAAVGAFQATARSVAGVDAERLAVDARAQARELWRAAPTYPFCQRIGISSWEGLWCRFEGDGDELRALRAWAAEFRRESWRRALAEQGVDDDALATDLGERFGAERRTRCETFADAAATLDALRSDRALALVTNGASCLQREKLAASGLGDRFDAIVVSGDIGRGKPDPAIFAHALRALGAEAGEAVMVGDNLVKDVEGALAAGLDAVWLNRDGKERPADGAHVREIGGLDQLPAVLG
jgi:putative hydrolase of the HAD superfamily